jgi:hypothetical protein
MTEVIQYRILGLSQLDIKPISQMHGATDYVVETPAPDPHRHNELTTLAILGGIGLINTAAAYFFGKRRSETIDLAVEVVNNDGSKRRIVLKLSKNQVEPVKSQILKQLQSVLGGGDT